MTAQEWLKEASRRLSLAGVSNYSQESCWLLEEIGQISRLQLLQNPLISIHPEKIELLESSLKKREEGFPLQYILGHTVFMGLNFLVNQNVLVPRPETEELVKWAHENLKKGAKILEIGVGSGCISISLKHYRPDLDITACDISEKALLAAEINMKEILGSDFINLVCSDCFSNINCGGFDAIISNPPYLSDSDMLNISKELIYEPGIALSCGEDGLDVYRKIAVKARDYLVRNGFIALEIGMGQEKKVADIFKDYLLLQQIKDYQGIVRDLIFRA